MHGRLKVKMTEEQAEAKRLEREKKLQQYVTITKAIFEKRKVGQLDKEGLELSNKVLGANPDFATLWNFRQETFLHLEKEESPEEMQVLCKAELAFLECCLRVNPKSYGTWHHRCWVMEHMPENWSCAASFWRSPNEIVQSSFLSLAVAPGRDNKTPFIAGTTGVSWCSGPRCSPRTNWPSATASSPGTSPMILPGIIAASSHSSTPIPSTKAGSPRKSF